MSNSSCGVKLQRKRQVLAAIQPDCSTMVLDLTKDNGGLEVSVAPMIEMEVERKERNVSRASITNLAGISGKISGSAKISTEFKGVGSAVYASLTDADLQGPSARNLAIGDAKLPALHPYLIGCAMDAYAVFSSKMTLLKYPIVDPDNKGVVANIEEDGKAFVPTGSAVYISTLDVSALETAIAAATSTTLLSSFGVPSGKTLATPLRTQGSEQVTLNAISKAFPLSNPIADTPLIATGTGTFLFVSEVNGVLKIVGYGTANAALSNVKGYSYGPISEDYKYLTIRNEEDGYMRTIYGAMGDLSISVENSDMAKFEFDFKGMLPLGYIAELVSITTAIPAGALIKFVVADVAPVDLDSADFVVVQNINVSTAKNLWVSLLREDSYEVKDILASEFNGSVAQFIYWLNPSTSTWNKVGTVAIQPTGKIRKVSHNDFTQTPDVVYDTTVPPTMKNANLIIDGYRPAFTKVDFKIGNEVALRQSANSANGYLAAIVNSRKPTASVDPELMDSADYDIYAKWQKGTTAYLEFAVDNGQVGNRLAMFAKKAQYTGASSGERDGVDNVSLEMALVGSSLDQNDEFLITIY